MWFVKDVRVRSGLLGLGGVATTVLLWHGCVAAGVISEAVLPRPAEVADAALRLLGDADFRRNLADTMLTWLIAVVLTTAIAVPTGLLIGWFEWLYRPSAGLIHVLRSIPPTALVPVAIVYLGLGGSMKVVLVCYAIAWPLLLNSAYGARSMSPMMLAAARSMRWPQRHVFSLLVLPASARYIGTGIRLAGGVALVVVLSAELLGASSGVGTLMIKYQVAELPDLVYASILIVGALGVVIFYGLTFVEQKVAPWAQDGAYRV